LTLLVRHGGEDERIDLSSVPSLLETFKALDSTSRYWLMNTIYHAYSEGLSLGRNRANSYWQTAAAAGRIKTRKVRGQNAVRVSVEPECSLFAS
jgi:hypothetical protein